MFWPRAIWRRPYPALKKLDLQTTMWLPVALVAIWRRRTGCQCFFEQGRPRALGGAIDRPAAHRLFGRPPHHARPLGHFAAVEDSIAILRGYGGGFWLLVQGLSQLRAVYPEADTFLSNNVQQAFGTQDYQTAHYLSQMLGRETIRVASESISRSASLNHNSTGASQSQSFHGRELMTPDEIRRLPTGQVIVLEQGQPPHLLQRLDYRTDPELQGRAQANPMHRTIARAG